MAPPTSTRRDFVRWLATLPLLQTASLATAAEPARRPRPPIRIGQIGVGHAHATKLGVYRKSPDYEVVGIVEPDPALRRQAEANATYRDLKWMTQEELLNTPGLQAVLVETRVADLLTTAEAAIAAGKHIHLDKPAGADFPHFRRIVDVARSKKLLIQMGYMFRYNPGVRLLNEVRREGWLGDLFEVHAVMSKVVGAGERKPLAAFSGGILFELGCHVVDLVVGQLGKPQQVTPYSQHVSPVADGLADNMLAVFTYPKSLASVKSSAQEVGGFERRHLVACGLEGTFQIQPLDNPSVRVTFAKPHGDYKADYQDIALPKYTRYVDDAADMARVIREEKESDFPYQHDLDVQEAVLRASGMWTAT